MNERFENLMYHAGLTASGCWDKMDDYDHDAIKKFAELIVRECANVCRDQPNTYALKTDRDNCAIAVEQHFGVEE
jgi:hypothetical protein